MKKKLARIVISSGEPAGIGPDIIVMLAQKTWPAEWIVVGDPDLLSERAKQLNLTLQLTEFEPAKTPTANLVGEIKMIPVKLATACLPGELTTDNASYVIECITLATELCLTKIADALVTAPVQKNIIHEAGIPFTGHTEFLADICKVQQSLMLFAVDTLKVALLTTHIPLNKVSAAVTPELLRKTLLLLHSELQTKFGIQDPTITVCGLNPHAGEKGLIGREEMDVIEPTLNALRKEGLQLIGPLPADTIFIEKNLQQTDAILGMYHDQVLPVIKYLGFDKAVNVTLGLPIIRTSVDHGTALDIAGTGLADPGSLEAALTLAIQLSAIV